MIYARKGNSVSLKFSYGPWYKRLWNFLLRRKPHNAGNGDYLITLPDANLFPRGTTFTINYGPANTIDTKWAIDDKMEFYIRAWQVYHKTADQIDGHIKYPRNQQERDLVGKAAKAGQNAMDDLFYMCSFRKPNHMDDPGEFKKFKEANLIALRRLGK